MNESLRTCGLTEDKLVKKCSLTPEFKSGRHSTGVVYVCTIGGNTCMIRTYYVYDRGFW